MNNIAIRRTSLRLLRASKTPIGLCNRVSWYTTATNARNQDSSIKKKKLSEIHVTEEPKRKVKFEKQNNSNNYLKFSTWKATILALFLGTGSYYYLDREKQKLEIQKEAEANRGYGTPLVGGPFKLKDYNGNEFTEKDLLGKFSIIYFGFSHCPDICPEELDKLGGWLNDLEKRGIKNLQPIFITCDPVRDTPEVLKKYLSDFHPGIIGLTGTYDEIKDVCHTYKASFLCHSKR